MMELLILSFLFNIRETWWKKNEENPNLIIRGLLYIVIKKIGRVSHNSFFFLKRKSCVELETMGNKDYAKLRQRP